MAMLFTKDLIKIIKFMNKKINMIQIDGDTVADTYLQLIKAIMHKGILQHDERNDDTKELLNVVCNISKPFGHNFFGIHDIDIPKGFPFGKQELDIYKVQFLSPDNKGFVYTYGERLNAYTLPDTQLLPINQIKELIKKLNNDGNTRRATAVTWNPYLDNANDDVPCLITIDFKIRDDKLYMTILYRSHDALLGWFPNLYGLCYLAEYVLSKVHRPIIMGSICIQSISANIRKTDWPLAKDIILANK